MTIRQLIIKFKKSLTIYFIHAIYKYNVQNISAIINKNNELIKLARKSFLARLLRKSQLLLQTVLSKPNKNVEISSRAFDYEQNVTEEQLLNTVKIIKRIQTHLTSQGKKLYVFLIPSKYLSHVNECCVNDALYKRFYSSLAKNEVVTIDVKSAFEKSNNQKKLFYHTDIHLTSLGHRVVAKSISAHLKK